MVNQVLESLAIGAYLTQSPRPLSPPWRSGGGARSSLLLCAPAQAHPGVSGPPPMSHLVMVPQRHSCHSGNCKGFLSSVPRARDKGQLSYSYDHYYIMTL